MWDGWVDVEHPCIHIIGHWNYEPGVKKNIYVVSSTEKVELSINGVSAVSGQQSYRFLFTFKDIEWKPGMIQAIGYDVAGKKLCQTQKKTAGKPDGIRLKVNTSPNGLLANGADLALIDVEVVDTEGNRCPTAMNKIEFSLEGPAQWRGGIAQGTDNYILSKILPVECGINRVLIRSATVPGKIVLHAKSEGLKSDSVEIVSKPFLVNDGLSLEMPDAGLISNLERGPTPKEPSFAVSRMPVTIAGATAGVNQPDAALSYDGNETTSWANDGKLETGWIKYDLEKTVAVSGVALKLSGWRTQSYPIRITVDEKEVFKGATERNLGYYTVRFEPVSGKCITVALIGVNKDEDVFNIVEVTGKKDEAGKISNDKKSKGTLKIVEVEIYEKS